MPEGGTVSRAGEGERRGDRGESATIYGRREEVLSEGREEAISEGSSAGIAGGGDCRRDRRRRALRPNTYRRDETQIPSTP